MRCPVNIHCLLRGHSPYYRESWTPGRSPVTVTTGCSRCGRARTHPASTVEAESDGAAEIATLGIAVLLVLAVLLLSGCDRLPPLCPCPPPAGTATPTAVMTRAPTPIPTVQATPTQTPSVLADSATGVLSLALPQYAAGEAELTIDTSALCFGYPEHTGGRCLDVLVPVTLWYRQAEGRVDRSRPILEVDLRGNISVPCDRAPCNRGGGDHRWGVQVRYSASLESETVLFKRLGEAAWGRCSTTEPLPGYHDRMPVGRVDGGLLRLTVRWDPTGLEVRTPAAVWRGTHRWPGSGGFGGLTFGVPRPSVGFSLESGDAVTRGARVQLLRWSGTPGSVAECQATE